MKKLLSLFLAAVLLTALLGGASAQAAGRWNNIVDVLAGTGFTVGLRSDGTVVYAGDPSVPAARDLPTWRNVERIELQGWEQYIVGYTRYDGVWVTSARDLSDYSYLTTWETEDYSGWEDVKQMYFGSSYCLCLLNSGELAGLAVDQEAAGKLRGIAGSTGLKQLAISNDFVVGLKRDGSVITSGDGSLEEQGYYWGNFSSRAEWTGIRELVTGYGCVFAIKNDGTVPGMDRGSWYNIDSLYFASDSMFGLRRDGTVTAHFSDYAMEDYRLRQVESWTNIVQLGFDGDLRYVPVGLRGDGTIAAVTTYDGTEPYGEWDFRGWSGVKTLYSGTSYTIGLRGDGSLLVTGGEFSTADFLRELRGWSGVEKIVAARGEYEDHVVGLKRDGTVVAAGDNSYGQCDLW